MGMRPMVTSALMTVHAIQDTADQVEPVLSVFLVQTVPVVLAIPLRILVNQQVVQVQLQVQPHRYRVVHGLAARTVVALDNLA